MDDDTYSTWGERYMKWMDEFNDRPLKSSEETKHEEKLRSERSHLRSLILAEKGRSGLESKKSIDRLIAAIQEQGFTID